MRLDGSESAGGKAVQMRSAIDKATNDAYLNIIPVKLGCGGLGVQRWKTSFGAF